MQCPRCAAGHCKGWNPKPYEMLQNNDLVLLIELTCCARHMHGSLGCTHRMWHGWQAEQQRKQAAKILFMPAVNAPKNGRQQAGWVISWMTSGGSPSRSGGIVDKVLVHKAPYIVHIYRVNMHPNQVLIEVLNTPKQCASFPILVKHKSPYL